METNTNSFGNFDDLVFENRNKEYGAFAIRKSYNDNLSFALFSTTSFFALVAIVAFLYSRNDFNKVNLAGQVDKIDSSFTVQVNLTPKELMVEKKIEKSTEKPPTPHTDAIAAVVTDKKTDDKIAINTDAHIVANGDTKSKDSVHVENMPNYVPGPAKKEETGPVVITAVMPEFNGDVFKFLRDNLVYPRMALANETSGTVYLTFVVEKDGSIGDVKSLKDVSDGCTEEAMRVVKLMPNWKPGRNAQGELQRVQYNLPVKFRIK